MAIINQFTNQRNFELNIPKSNAFLLQPKSTIGTITTTSSIRQAMEKMKFHGYTAVPVVTEQGEYYGTISEGDFLWHLVNQNSSDLKEEEDLPVSKIMRKPWNPPVRFDTPLEDVLDKVLNQNFIPVVDDRNIFMGIITRKSVLQYLLFVYDESSQ